MKAILKYFFQGLLYTVPVVATIYVIYVGFSWLDSLLPAKYPGLGILIVLAAITVIGWLGTYIITAPVVSFGNKLLKSCLLYTSPSPRDS